MRILFDEKKVGRILPPHYDLVLPDLEDEPKFKTIEHREKLNRCIFCGCEKALGENCSLTDYEKEIVNRKINFRSCADTKSFFDRAEMVKKYSWAIPNHTALAFINNYGKILEVGSGNGYWGYELRKRFEADIVLTDVGEDKGGYTFSMKHGDILKMEALEAVKRYRDRTLMMVWPSYDENWMEKALKSYNGQFFIYVGEGSGGCTGNEEFHEHLYHRWEEVRVVEIPQWAGIHDSVYIYRRK